MQAPLLEIVDLSVAFRRFEGVARVLDSVSFSLEAGGRVAIVGESGCGKSLTARAIVGLLDPLHAEISGKILLNGFDLAKLSQGDLRKIRGRQISMIFQDPTAALNPVFRIGTQITETMLATGAATNRKQALERAAEQLRAVNIRDPMRVLRAYPFELSGGMAQRILIVMGTISRPQVIIADEPGASLDVRVQNRALTLLDKLGAETGAAILMITHNFGVVRKFARQVVVMYAGTVVETGQTDEILANPVHPYTRALLAAVPRLDGARLPTPIDGVVPSYVDAPSGCRFATRCPIVIDRCKATRPVLEPAGAAHRAACIRTVRPSELSSGG
jgi:oligopeptide/dipeptide ABC transporter ATP-binding protein